MSKTRIYTVRDRDTGTIRLVEASTAAAARHHVTASRFDDAGCISGPHRPAHLSRRDTLGDKAVRWACAAGAVAVVGVLVGERLV